MTKNLLFEWSKPPREGRERQWVQTQEFAAHHMVEWRGKLDVWWPQLLAGETINLGRPDGFLLRLKAGQDLSDYEPPRPPSPEQGSLF